MPQSPEYIPNRVSLKLGLKKLQPRINAFVQIAYVDRKKEAPATSKLLKGLLSTGLEEEIRKLPAADRRKLAS